MPPKEKISCICLHCDEEFFIFAYRIAYGEGKYCSHSCSDQGRKRPLADRFWEKVQKTNKCWLWTGYCNAKGYGQFYADGDRRPAHQVAWEMENGPLPDGQEICHKCDNPPCVRGSHLFAGTRKDNVQDMIKKGRRSSLAHGSGERHGMAKLTEIQVVEILRRYANHESPKALAVEFGVNSKHLHGIIAGRTWKHVPRP